MATRSSRLLTWPSPLVCPQTAGSWRWFAILGPCYLMLNPSHNLPQASDDENQADR